MSANIKQIKAMLERTQKQKVEKQKYDRMKPIYDARESFESALEKAWKDYDESGARTVDSCEDDYVECAHAKGFREGYLFGIEKQKEQKPEEWSEADEAMRDNILRLLSYFVGTVECDSNPSLSTSYPIFQREMDWLKSLRPQPKRKQSPALKKIMDNMTEEKLAKTRAEMKTVEEEPTEVEEEHPDNFTSFEWLVGRLMFRGCDLRGMTDGEDDNGIVTKLIKDRAAEMMGLLERELDPMAEPVDLEEEIRKHTDLFHADIEYPLRLTAIKFYELGRKGGGK